MAKTQKTLARRNTVGYWTSDMPSHPRPKIVPILHAVDFTCNTFDNGKEQRCLLGWRNRIFGVRRGDEYGVCRVTEAFRKHFPEENRNTAITEANDEKLTTRQCATVWNRAMASLGFVVGNPEAANAGKRIRKYTKRGARS